MSRYQSPRVWASRLLCTSQNSFFSVAAKHTNSSTVPTAAVSHTANTLSNPGCSQRSGALYSARSRPAYCGASHNMCCKNALVLPQQTQCRGIWDILKRRNFGKYTVVDKVGEVSAAHPVPAHILCPPYAATGEPSPPPANPEVKSEWQVKCMREACALAAQVQSKVADCIKVGMTTEAIDAVAHQHITAAGAYPSPLNYLGFPKSVCTSVNNVACHGIPDDRPLHDGDIVSVDITVLYDGYNGDCCATYLVGQVDEAGQHLVEAAYQCLQEAIDLCAPGVPFANIGARVELVAAEENVTVVPCFTGHGIGSYFHGPPDIYHCYNNYPGSMEAGMTFTIEPIVAQGKEEVLILEDGWTAVMLDNGRAAQFEHTILITDTGHEVLTL